MWRGNRCRAPRNRSWCSFMVALGSEATSSINSTHTRMLVMHARPEVMLVSSSIIDCRRPFSIQNTFAMLQQHIVGQHRTCIFTVVTGANHVQSCKT